MRVVSQETFTYMSAVGVVVSAGSAHEKELLGTVGGANLAEVCAWRGTHARSSSEILKAAESCGAYLHANAQREQTLFCVDALRENLGEARGSYKGVLRWDLDAGVCERSHRSLKTPAVTLRDRRRADPESAGTPLQ